MCVRSFCRPVYRLDRFRCRMRPLLPVGSGVFLVGWCGQAVHLEGVEKAKIINSDTRQQIRNRKICSLLDVVCCIIRRVGALLCKFTSFGRGGGAEERRRVSE